MYTVLSKETWLPLLYKFGNLHFQIWNQFKAEVIFWLHAYNQASALKNNNLKITVNFAKLLNC